MNERASPIQRGVIGELFWTVPDPMVVVGPSGIHLLNPAAQEKFGLSSEEATAPDFELSTLFGVRAAERFWKLVRAGERGIIDCLNSLGFVFALVPVRLALGGNDYTAVIFRDETTESRQLTSLRHLNAIAREVLSGDSVDLVLQQIVDDAKELTRASFTALLILKENSATELSRFVYNAPRELFPDRLPRAVGLLAVPIQTRTAARLDDIRDHPAGLGIPGVHPPIGPLLAVPIILGEEVVGEVAVANPPEGRTFDELDEAVLAELGLHAAQALRQATTRELAVEIEEERRAMMDMLRHDIATPIATAKGAVQLLSTSIEQMSPDQIRTLLEATSRSISGIERLAENLSVDVRLDQPFLSEELSELSTQILLDELYQDLLPLAEQKSIDLSFVVEDDTPPGFVGAPLLVRQAIENLVMNAIKFSDREGNVVLTARAEGASVRFDVRDEGPGIPLEEQGGLFERFKRAKTMRRSPGLGLGLSIVKRVAKVHGGTIGVSSKPGHGSTFWITFPVENWRPAVP